MAPLQVSLASGKELSTTLKAGCLARELKEELAEQLDQHARPGRVPGC